MPDGKGEINMSMDVISTYVILGFGGIVIIATMIKSIKKISTLIINSLIGGTLFVILNILGLNLPVNIVTILITALLGVPGVILVVLYMLIMGVWR